MKMIFITGGFAKCADGESLHFVVHRGKEFYFRSKLSVVRLCLLPFVLPVETTEKNLIPSFISPPIRSIVILFSLEKRRLKEDCGEGGVSLFSQIWCQDHFPADPLPVTEHPLGDELFPTVQYEVSLAQLHPIPSCPVTGDQGEEISNALLEEAVDCSEVSPRPSLLQDEQTK
ncbi:hypothetical protein BTVI_15421 [Pitangus sulphuratus]|nr:hypothetical protein BTVI_15421 [Pitangus sulphuratus]